MNKYALLAGAAVFALTSTNVMATPTSISTATAQIDAQIHLVSEITIAKGETIDFGKFASIPNQTITLSGGYSYTSNGAADPATGANLETSLDYGTATQGGEVHHVQFGEGHLGTINITAPSLSMSYDFYDNGGALTGYSSEYLENEVDYLDGFFGFQFEPITLRLSDGTTVCGTVQPAFISFDMAWSGDSNSPLTKNYSTAHIGGTFTQGENHIDGLCSGTGTATLILNVQ